MNHTPDVLNPKKKLTTNDGTRDPKQVLTELLKILRLEKIEENIFRGLNVDLGMGNVFGGQVLGQALSAASQTVPQDRRAHSLHAYFMRHGDPSLPIIYNVDCIRDGQSFTTRRVVAIQKGKAIFSMAASFHIEEPGFEHFDQMPQVPQPEELLSERELAARSSTPLPARILNRVLGGFPLEFRHAIPPEPYPKQKTPPHKYVWIRTTGSLPDDPALQRCVLSFASDFYLVIISLFPHEHTIWEKEIQAASLDHAMWFHREFSMDDWLLYAIDSPNAGNARGIGIGRIFNRQGLLVATVAQEGLIRYLPFTRERGGLSH